jgi:2,4-diketo-3-deoxy-L-fuconate hydrolase
MKICRFDDDRLGLVEGQEVLDVSEALDAIPALRWPLPPGDPLIANLDAVRARIEAVKGAATRKPLTAVRLNSPVATPNKVIGAPVNYQRHLDEANANRAAFGQTQEIRTIDQYGPFLKANSSLVGPDDGIALRFTDRRNDHEGELAVVIGKTADRISIGEAYDHIAGYAIGLDMTVRGGEDRSVRKSIDSYSVLGPWLITRDEIADPNHLDLKLWVNDELRQDSNVERLVEWCSGFYTLYPGDVIMTGTPEGVGPVKDGDVIRCTIERVGEINVKVRNA